MWPQGGTDSSEYSSHIWFDINSKKINSHNMHKDITGIFFISWPKYCQFSSPKWQTDTVTLLCTLSFYVWIGTNCFDNNIAVFLTNLWQNDLEEIGHVYIIPILMQVINCAIYGTNPSRTVFSTGQIGGNRTDGQTGPKVLVNWWMLDSL